MLDPQTGTCSTQIDILVRDSEHSAPFFRESGTTICDPKSVLAILEVKTSFTAGTLAEALGSLKEIRKGINDSSGRIWCGFWFATCAPSRTDESAIQTILEQVRSMDGAHTAAAGAARLPTCIICADKFCCFVSEASNGDPARLRYFPTGQMSISVAIIDLIGHVYSAISAEGFQPVEIGLQHGLDVTPVIRRLF